MNTKTQKSIIIYRSTIYALSGVETWVCNLCQQLCDFYKIKLLYDGGDYKQITEICKYAEIEKRNKTKSYDCDILIGNYVDSFPDNVSTKKIISTIHSNYFYSRPKATKQCFGTYADLNICVSEDCEKAFNEYSDRESIVIPNMLSKKAKTSRILHLVSFTRLTKEKGFERIKRLAELLKKHNIKFDWKIFTDNKSLIDSIGYEEVIYMPVTYDKYDYIVDADYLVQLSDSEAFCYSVHEALQYGTPVIVTDLEVFKDIVIDGYNGYKLPLGMENIDVVKIVNKIPKSFRYADKTTEIKKKWFEILGTPVKKSAKKKKQTLIELEVIESYHDKLFNKQMIVGERFSVDKLRAEELTGENNAINRAVCKKV